MLTDGTTDQWTNEARNGQTDRQTDGRTGGRTDRCTDRWTDRPSYRDTWTYLNKFGMNNDASWMKEDEVEDEDEEDSLLTS